MPEENVKVAVRVRPFNSREKGRNAKLIIDMNGSTTQITDPNGAEEPRKFTFDYSYWSHDGCKEEGNGYFGPDSSHANGRKFADQKKVYNELGVGVLSNAWEGYNSTLFAYGQTGSGKSWSMVGYGVNKGIVPMFCDNIFKQIEEKKAAGDATQFEVTFSMLEIYNEQVRDLLDPKPAQRGGLKVRQHPKHGFYADGLKVTPVNSYMEIEKKMEEGTTNRTVASTNMNATSSRAHTIVGITFVQKFINAAGEETAKTAVVNLVDLAGSERADSTGATGDRLKEGAAINQSLSCLGNCIAALADKASGKDTRVPYRDSVLTKLLKNALGGNSKTIMIAALSPADINYDETLSTLRYADRAKQIKTSASVNEDPTEKLIRELQEENEKLKAMMASGKFENINVGDDEDDMTEEEKEKIRQELKADYDSILENNKKEMEEMKKSFEQKLKEAEEAGDRGGQGGDLSAQAEKRKNTPHIYNLNMDPQLTGHVIFFLENDSISVGNVDEEGVIRVRGPGIQQQHAKFTKKDNKFIIEPCAVQCRLLVNGKLVGTATELKHNDRLLFGTTQFFVYQNPAEKDPKLKEPDITYEFAQDEIARKSGIDLGAEDDGLLQEEILEMLPKVEEANSISQELDKKLRFDMMIVTPGARGELKGRTEVMVKVTNLENKIEWIWPRTKLLNRLYVMKEMFEEYTEGEEWQRTPDKDPFVDDVNADFHIGSCKVFLTSLSYLIESKPQLKLVDYQGQEVGLLNVEIMPCDAKGKEYTEEDDIFVDTPEELLGKDIHFKFKVISARGLPSKFTDVFCRFKWYLDDKAFESKRMKDTNNPDWNLVQQIDVKGATMAVIDYLKESGIMVTVWGKQKIKKGNKVINTKDKMLQGQLAQGQIHAAPQAKRFDAEKVKYMMEAAMLKKRQQQLEQKVHALKKMLEKAEECKKKRITVALIRQIYNAHTADEADKCIALIPNEKDDSDDEGDTPAVNSKKNEEQKLDKDQGGKKEQRLVPLAPPGKNKKDYSSDHSSKSSSSSSSDDEDEDGPQDEEKKRRKMEKKKRKELKREKKRMEKEQQKLHRQNTAPELRVKRKDSGSKSCVLL